MIRTLLLSVTLLLAGCNDWAIEKFYPRAADLPKQEKVLILRGLTHYSQDGWPMAPLKAELEKAGFIVSIGNHTIDDLPTDTPDILIGHSMGGNTALRLASAQRTAKQPRLIITLDPGKAPLWHSCPAKVRCVNLYSPRLLIGGQTVKGAENYKVKDVPHGTFPLYEKVYKNVTRIALENK